MTIKLVFVACILSVVGAMMYSVVIGLSVNAGPSTSPSRLALLAVVLVVLPVLIMIAIQDNRPISRPLILVWTIAGICMFATADRWASDEIGAGTVIATCLAAAAIVLWLYASRTLVCFYALLKGRPVPDGLEEIARRLVDPDPEKSALRRFADWLADHFESLVLIGFSLLAVFACVDAAGSML